LILRRLIGEKKHVRYITEKVPRRRETGKSPQEHVFNPSEGRKKKERDVPGGTRKAFGVKRVTRDMLGLGGKRNSKKTEGHLTNDDGKKGEAKNHLQFEACPETVFARIRIKKKGGGWRSVARGEECRDGAVETRRGVFLLGEKRWRKTKPEEEDKVKKRGYWEPHRGGKTKRSYKTCKRDVDVEDKTGLDWGVVGLCQL